MTPKERAAMQQAHLPDVFDYKNGKLYWKVAKSRCVHVGEEAGCVDKSTGYVKVSLDGKSYGAHRLIFLMHHGCLPKNVDHVNMNRSDNRIENLRAATVANNTQNSKCPSNSKTGVKGVCLDKRTNKYMATVQVDGKRFNLGRFSTIAEATAAVQESRSKHHGGFANHG